MTKFQPRERRACLRRGQLGPSPPPPRTAEPPNRCQMPPAPSPGPRTPVRTPKRTLQRVMTPCAEKVDPEFIQAHNLACRRVRKTKGTANKPRALGGWEFEQLARRKNCGNRMPVVGAEYKFLGWDSGKFLVGTVLSKRATRRRKNSAAKRVPWTVVVRVGRSKLRLSVPSDHLWEKLS